MSEYLESVIKAADAGQLSCAGLNSVLEDELEKLCAEHNDRNTQQTLLRSLETRTKRFNPDVAALVSKIDQMRRASDFTVPDHYSATVLQFLGKRTQTQGTRPAGTTKPSWADDTPTTHADSGDGKQHAVEDDFESGLARFHQANASMSHGKATEAFMRTPEGAAAYRRSKAARLNKAATLQGH